MKIQFVSLKMSVLFKKMYQNCKKREKKFGHLIYYYYFCSVKTSAESTCLELTKLIIKQLHFLS